MSPLYTVSLFLLLVLVQASSIQVQVHKAVVQGVYTKSSGVDAFRGVKYATSQRFKRAVLSTYDTHTTINASSFGVACPQIKGLVSCATAIYSDAVDHYNFVTASECPSG